AHPADVVVRGHAWLDASDDVLTEPTDIGREEPDSGSIGRDHARGAEARVALIVDDAIERRPRDRPPNEVLAPPVARRVAEVHRRREAHVRAQLDLMRQLDRRAADREAIALRVVVDEPVVELSLGEADVRGRA